MSKYRIAVVTDSYIKFERDWMGVEVKGLIPLDIFEFVCVTSIDGIREKDFDLWLIYRQHPRDVYTIEDYFRRHRVYFFQHIRYMTLREAKLLIKFAKEKLDTSDY